MMKEVIEKMKKGKLENAISDASDQYYTAKSPKFIFSPSVTKTDQN